MSFQAQRDLIAQYRAIALNRVLRHGAELPFYRRRWMTVPGAAAPPLHSLPEIAKSDIPTLCQPVMTPRALGRVLVSSGSTATPMIRGWSQADQVSRRSAARQYTSGGGLRGVLLDLEECAHGVRPSPIIEGGVRLRAPMLSPDLLDRAWTLIERWRAEYGSKIPIVAALGAPWTIATFAAYLRWRGIDPQSLGMNEVYCYADRLPAYMAQEFREWFGTTVRDVFSLSEALGCAVRCAQCGHFHFHHSVLPEFIDPIDGKAVEEGLARLVITELLPTEEQTPLIRYDTGDLVDVVPSDCAMGVDAFEVVGRAATSPRHPVSGEVLIPDRLIGDALMASALVAREPVPCWWGSPFEEAILEPLHVHTLRGTTLALNVQRAAPAPGRREHADTVVRALVAQWPRLAAHLKHDIRVEVTFTDELTNPSRPKWRAHTRREMNDAPSRVA